MKIGICQSCGKLATQTCSVCGAAVCIQCIIPSDGCKVCNGKKKI